ncbi:MAG: hybrid sensor histidine kinase/response regulator [Candidatus Cloacimonetes bacterium]|nr:hybrid sensor histidine kinase/response regulator [Candidatus Cloacimonadota bacterium]
MIVDDEDRNLQILGSVLDRVGYEVMFAQNGKEAIQAAVQELPDLILLDVMMPDMNGFEVCKYLKSLPDTEQIPVIFVTARMEAADVVQGFSCGGCDYITKPFEGEELLVRVSTQLELKKAQLRLAEKTSELEESLKTVTSKNLELASLNHEKNEILGIASHDLRRGIASIIGLSQLVRDGKDLALSEIFEMVGMIEEEGVKLNELVTSLIDVHAIEQGHMSFYFQILDLRDVMENLLRPFMKTAAKKKIQIEYSLGDTPAPVNADIQALRQIFENLISNAIKFSPIGSVVGVFVRSTAKGYEVAIQDKGPGFSPEDLRKVYQKFARLSARPTADENSTGLGLSIVKSLVDYMHADLRLETELGAGSTFVISLARAELSGLED